MGSAPWTASAANLSNTTGWQISIFLAITAVSVAFLNMWLAMRINWLRLLGNIFFGIAFSILVGVFANYFVSLGIRQLSWWWRIPLDLFGIWTIGVAMLVKLK